MDKKLNEKKRKPLLNGQFVFKDDDTVVCIHCHDEFKYHRSTSSLSYHLRTKHAFAATDAKPKTTHVATRQPNLDEMVKNAKPMEQARYNNITNAIAKWIATNARPTNIITDDGLQAVIRVA